jgi:hypothetical protein
MPIAMELQLVEAVTLWCVKEISRVFIRERGIVMLPMLLVSLWAELQNLKTWRICPY